MAYRWRIRHKLMLGLGLVVGIMALMLGGTLKGLMSYRATMKTVESKLAELQAAGDLKGAVRELDPGNREPARASQKRAHPRTSLDFGPVVENEARRDDDEKAQFEWRMSHARATLDAYRDQLNDTLSRGRDPEQGFRELALIRLLEDRFLALERVKNEHYDGVIHDGPTTQLADDPNVKTALKSLRDTADELQVAIYEDLTRRSKVSKLDYRTSMIIVTSTSVLGMLLMAGLLRFFYGWVFYPIRDLEEGAGKVARGDFEHKIEVHSGDEMEDLAAAFNDMTSRLREIYHDLARQVNERSRQLVRSERLASVGFLAAGVAHEINNPLASIAFCSEALERRLAEVLNRRPAGEADTAVVTKYLKMIQQEAFRCKAITQRLLEFSRGGERKREPADLAELIQGVLDMVQHLQSCKGKRILFEPSAPPGKGDGPLEERGTVPVSGRLVAWVNAQEIKSVVLNLVVNALDSMDEGGTLTITLTQRDGMARVVFTDTGCGMSPEILDNIFEPFFTRSRTGKGTGLGLAISHRVINQHGGEIEAASPGLNKGSTFTVRLPLRPPAEPVKEESLGHAAA